jgi:hypothetical protein
MKRSSVLILFLALATSSAGAQQPTPPFGDIVACARALNCKNMQASTTHWYYVVNIPVLTFKDGDAGYALAASTPGSVDLAIWITLQGEVRPSRHFTVDPGEHVLVAELGWVPGDCLPPCNLTAAEQEVSRRAHKAYLAPGQMTRIPGWGEEFKPFWEEQTKQAMAAIRRQIGK